MTAGAQEFVRPATFEALTGRPVLTSLWERGRALAHIGLARQPDLIVLAPATAHVIARAALGLADDLLTSLLLARTVPILAAPAMNDVMYAHPATQQNLRTLAGQGWQFVGPASGSLAEGPSDLPGRMSEPEDIFLETARMLRTPGSWFDGKRVVVTAGPTREAIDPIRVITNRSSGRMGYALAAAAWRRGAGVTLIAGPSPLTLPHGPVVVRVESTQDLLERVAECLPDTDCLIMAAAPADFRPVDLAPQKRARAPGTLSLALEGTPDVLEGTRRRRKKGARVVGFAYETERGLERAREKLSRKGLDLMVVNFAGEAGAGAEVDTNRVTLLTPGQADEVPLLPKTEVAERILDAVEALR